jgi:hypothetical protein
VIAVIVGMATGWIFRQLFLVLPPHHLTLVRKELSALMAILCTIGLIVLLLIIIMLVIVVTPV